MAVSKKKGIILGITISTLIGLSLGLFFYFSNNEFRNTSFDKQWGLYNKGKPIEHQAGKKGVDINIKKAWNLTKGSAEVIVGVLDTGIDINCDEIKHSIFYNNKEIPGNGMDDDHNGYIDDVNGWDFYRETNEVYDTVLHDQHGTFLCGIIAAKHDGNEIFGVAPNVTILPLKFMQGATGQIDDAIKAIEYAHFMGARIVNCSWDNDQYNEKMERVIQKYSDTLFVCSAGNAMQNLDKTPIYPACYDSPNVISVGAVDNQGLLYDYSGYGKQVDVAAPGAHIYSTMPDNKYTFSDGASMAAAYVSGVAALVKSCNPELNGAQIAEILKSHSKEVIEKERNRNSGTNGTESFVTINSGGIIDAFACVKNAIKTKKP